MLWGPHYMNDGDARKNILSRVSPDMGDYGNGESNTGERERESRRGKA